jgi:anti-sigma factor RsiW
MTCRQLIEFLDDYCSGALPPDECARFNEPLAACIDCRNYLESYKRTMRLGKLALSEDEAAPPDVPESLIAAILASRK